MATTVGTTLPMAALVDLHGAHSAPTRELYSDDTAIVIGDVVIADGTPSGRVIQATGTAGAVTAGTVVGVAVGATGTAGDAALVALALPGVQFTANIVDGAADETGVLADNILRNHDLILSADGAWCLDQDAAVQNAYTLAYARQKGTSTDPTQLSRPQTSGVGVTNPRAVFVFTSSVFITDIYGDQS